MAQAPSLALAQGLVDARRRREVRWLVGLGVALVVVFALALTLGPYPVSVAEVVGHFFGTPHAVVALRLERTLLAIGVGGGLGLAGAALQGLFRNPLADPGLIGVASGARLGAVAFIVGGGGAIVAASPTAALLLLPATAFTGALATMAIVRRMAQRAGATSVATLLLGGLALTVFEEAFVGLLTALADDQALRTATLWRLGSVAGATPGIIGAVLGVTVVGAAILLPLWRPLDAMLLGEREAHHLGVPLESLKRRLVVVSALVVATATAFAGIVAFVGLAVPHLARLAIGPSHRALLPASLLGGALLVVFADVVARTIAAPIELPLGVVTSLIGAPVLLRLVIGTRPA